MQHVDVLVVGAGLSGIAAGYHLKTTCPDRTWEIWEARDALGGTWDLFRYPGIRSDSDMYTLGYSFRPWTEQKAIADGPSILKYVQETAEAFGIDQKIRYGRRVVSASWSSETARWTVEATCTKTGDTVRITCQWLMMCSGYYDYDAGYTPEFEGVAEYGGRVVHPQQWPDDLEVEGKRIVVIGSGATAVTLVPELARRGAKVVMLQRTPSYVVSVPSVDVVAERLKATLSPETAYRLVRWKNVLLGMGTFAMSRRFPKLVRGALTRGARHEVGPTVDVDTHFAPPYNPWDQRLCLVPDADLFRVLREGSAEVVTDHVARFTPTGIALRSGRHLEADVVVTATGLTLKFLAGMKLEVDGREMDPASMLLYNGVMLSGVPNLGMAFGYTNASWTLKCDLSCKWVARMMNHLRDHGHRMVMPDPRPPVRREKLVDFSSGYFQRALGQMPQQGHRAPWRVYQNYFLDLLMFQLKPLAGEGLTFS